MWASFGRLEMYKGVKKKLTVEAIWVSEIQCAMESPYNSSELMDFYLGKMLLKIRSNS